MTTPDPKQQAERELPSVWISPCLDEEASVYLSKQFEFLLQYVPAARLAQGEERERVLREALERSYDWIAVAAPKMLDCDNHPANLVQMKNREALAAAGEGKVL